MARSKSNKLLEDNDDLDWGRFIGSGIIFLFLLVSFLIAAGFLYMYFFASTASGRSLSTSSSSSYLSASSSLDNNNINNMQKDINTPPSLSP